MTETQVSALKAALSAGPHHVSEADAVIAPEQTPVRLIATYLPQFHLIPENDAWWGPGFTEWTNAVRGIPRWAGHHQPILPADLGFYDLRLVETMRRQAAMARRYGIHGFCFHTYWFGGKRLLETPLELLLSHTDIDLPFCVCWANENWTRRWDGLDEEVLISQQHSPEDDIAFIRAMEPAFRDPRYIRVGGRPVLIVYRPHLLPDPVATARRWRVHMVQAGLGEPHLVMAQAFGQHDPRLIGFDAAMEFPPHKVGFGVARTVPAQPFDADNASTVLDYAHMVDIAIAQVPPPYRLYYGVCPRWDNEARRPNRGTSFANATPERYRHWLTAVCDRTVLEQPEHERLVFVNSWNEWAEGAPLEPDRHFGHAYLSATAEVMVDLARRVWPGGPPGLVSDNAPGRRAASAAATRVSRPAPDAVPRIALVAHDAHFHGAQMLALNLARSIAGDRLAKLELLLGDGGELENAMAEVAPTRKVDAGFADTVAWRRAAADLVERGIGTVLVNTVVSAQALPALRDAGLRTVCLVHELPRLIADYKLEDAARWVAELADVVVFPNEAVRAPFVAAFGQVRGRTVIRGQGLYRRPMPLEARPAARARMRARLGLRDEETLVLGLGFGDRRKGLDLWPEIASAVRAAGRPVRFAWVGDIEPSLRPMLEEAIRSAGLEGTILLTGRSTQPEEYLVAADIFLLSSREDPFPSAAMEAAAHALPVVCFEGSGGMEPFVRETGLRPPRMEDARSAANAILDLAADPALRAAAGTAAERIISERYDFADYARFLVDISAPPAPSVTAVVPNYNYARYLKERIGSIERQTCPVAEIIVLDDASTDESLAVLDEVRAACKVPVRLVANQVNSGSVSRQWALAFELAKTPLVWVAEADDLSEPTFLEGLLDAFEDPGVVMAYAQSKMIDAKGTVTAPDYLDYTEDVDPTLWQTDYVRSGIDEIASALSVKNTIPNVSAALFRREAALPVIREALEDMVRLRNTADWLFYIRLLQTGSVAFRADALNLHRRHAGGVTMGAANRRHLDEIARMQATARCVVAVGGSQCQAARKFLHHAAKVFGLAERDAAEAAAVSGLLADDDAGTVQNSVCWPFTEAEGDDAWHDAKPR